jgi:hypothetical protein
MHLVDRITLFLMPTSILAASFAITLAVWSLEPSSGSRVTGAAVSVYCFVLAAAMLCVTRGLPFALGMGSSRRAFTLGTGLTGLVLAVVMGTAYLVLNRLEVLTHGWWLHGAFFELPWFHGTSPALLWVVFTVAFLAVFMLGALVAAVWFKWNSSLLVVGAPAAIVVVGGGAVLLTWQHGWDNIWHWFGDLTPMSMTGWLAAATVVFAGLTWATLRRVRAA